MEGGILSPTQTTALIPYNNTVGFVVLHRHELTASLSSGGFSSIPLMFLSTHTQVSSDCRNVSLSMCETRLGRVRRNNIP